MSKFEKIYNKIKSRYNFFESPIVFNRIDKDYVFYKEKSYLKLYKALICEDYNIFPVPRQLLNNMLGFSLNHNSLEEKIYTCKDILEKYIFDWKYYYQFKENVKLMIKKNINCSITLALYDNFNDLIKIFEKYKNNKLKNKIIEQFKNSNQISEGIAYIYGNEFNVCLAINCSIKNKFILTKTIQHELIHWMQVSLNSETGKTYGKFKNQQLRLSPFNKFQLLGLGVDYEYLLDEFEFEPWVANTIEEFSISGLNVDEYKKIIENNDLFTNKINNAKNQGEYEMYIFGMICYIVSNRKYESYWYYLIEAMREN